ncbi:potassium transporter-domain-containing protein [Geranomyces variabilis]|nr:potassium transporter-domain-containing protein [Geranomyces variabilis]KAJ3137269.1 hypothetical protein HDU90_002055 [Geranomyces variabilis]
MSTSDIRDNNDDVESGHNTPSRARAAASASGLRPPRKADMTLEKLLPGDDDDDLESGDSRGSEWKAVSTLSPANVSRRDTEKLSGSRSGLEAASKAETDKEGGPAVASGRPLSTPKATSMRRASVSWAGHDAVPPTISDAIPPTILTTTEEVTSPPSIAVPLFPASEVAFKANNAGAAKSVNLAVETDANIIRTAVSTTPTTAHPAHPNGTIEKLKPPAPMTPGLPVNPFNASMKNRKRRQSIAPAGERRMSLGVALCIPPSSRIGTTNMSVRQLLKLCSGALGIVYGEISVSPLYVLKTIFHQTQNDDGTSVPHKEEEIMGAISILFWIVTLVCCVKYMWLVLKADKTGEGGTWALMSLLPLDDRVSPLHKYKAAMFTTGLLAASFLVGDVVISPSITVLSAFEGVASYAAGSFTESMSIGCTCIVLFLIFNVQRFGTAKVQKVAGPLAILWFLSIAMIGLYNIAQYPKILASFSPHYVGYYIKADPLQAFTVLGHIVLSVAGVEAMYTDLGHFSTRPIRVSFMGVVYPAIVLNYFGQAAHLVGHPEAASNPFFESVPNAVQWPVLVLATCAAIMAAQGGISGCFSLIDQSMSLGVFPDCKVSHPNPEHGAEVYIPLVNNLLLAGTITLACIFRNSENLANTAGICVAGSMTVTSFLYILVMNYQWDLPKWKTILFASLFVPLDLLLFASTLLKVSSNGWVSIAIAACLFAVMYTWTTTTREINDWLRDRLLLMTDLRHHVKAITRTPGTVVYVSNTDEDVPNVLSVCAGRLGSLPTNIVCMTAVAQQAPFVADDEKIVFRTIDAVNGIYRLVISYGYAERTIDVVAAMTRAKKRGLRIQPGEDVNFIVGQEIVLSGSQATWFRRARRSFYHLIVRNTQTRVDYYNLPHVHTLEMRIHMLMDEDSDGEGEEKAAT